MLGCGIFLFLNIRYQYPYQQPPKMKIKGAKTQFFFLQSKSNILFGFLPLEVYYVKYEINTKKKKKRKKVSIILTNSDYIIHQIIISCIVQMDHEKKTSVWISIRELRSKQAKFLNMTKSNWHSFHFILFP
jgi:hypothetical protein